MLSYVYSRFVHFRDHMPIVFRHGKAMMISNVPIGNLMGERSLILVVYVNAQ